MAAMSAANRRRGGHGEGAYPLAADLARPAARVAMPRLPRLHAPGGTVHVVGRCNNREFCFTTPADFRMLIAQLAEMARTYTITLYAYTLMANHVHLLLQTPHTDPLARPLRWFFRETTRAWQRTHGRQGHFWERRYWACLVDDDPYALAALRYLDRNPVRAGLVDDPAAYPWSSCAVYALGAANPLVSPHPSYLGLSPYATIRQRQYRALMAPSADPTTDARDPRWSTQRAIGSAPFVARYTPRRGRRRLFPVPLQIQLFRSLRVSGTCLVTHDQEEALSISDRVAIMDAGRIRQVGSPIQVYTRPADRFVADFVGIANFLPGTVRKVTAEGLVVESPLGILTAQPRPDVREGHRVTILLRPEALRLALTPGGGGLSARIRSTSFLGGTRRHRVQVGELELVVDEAFSSLVEEPGRETWLTVDAERLHVLPAEPA